MSTARVFSGYRRLFRARKNLFKGDDYALKESKMAIRQQFLLNKNAPTSGEHFEGLLTMVDEAEDMLRTSFVQGKLDEKSGNYKVKIEPQHTANSGGAPVKVEPVTSETVKKMQKPMVETTKSDSSSTK